MSILSAADVDSAIAEIDLGALARNLDRLRRRAGTLDVMAVVKANAYGHGAIAVTRFLADQGVERFAVATLPEAIALRDAGITQGILVFAAPLPEQLQHYVRYDLEVTITSPAVAAAVIRTARLAGPLRTHVKVDTGMGRIGLAPDETIDVIRSLERAPSVSIEGFWTHFATSDEPDDPFMREQWHRFRGVIDLLGGAPAPVHAANSGGLLTNKVALDPTTAHGVRLGIALYGLYDPPEASDPDRLEPVMRFVSRLTQIKTVPAGTPVSYGATWRAPVDTRIGTVAVGYADGYRRSLSNRSRVGVAGRSCPIAGRVCMDMIMIDLGPENEGPPARCGDPVVLFGNGGPSVFEVARWADTITYEIVCGITSRVSRRYLHS